MKKALTTLFILALLGGATFVFLRVTGIEDTWVQDKATGEWVRLGNPSGPAPLLAVEDCFARAGRAYASAVERCTPTLCGTDEVCINDLLDSIEALGSQQSLDTGSSVIAPDFAAPIAVPPDSAAVPDAGAGGGMMDAVPAVPDAASPEAATSFDEGETEGSATMNEDVRVIAPRPTAALTSPFEVRGEVQDGISSVIVRVKGSNGVTLIEETLTPRAPAEGGWRPFKITLAYDFDTTKNGLVEVEPRGGEAISVAVEFR